MLTIAAYAFTSVDSLSQYAFLFASIGHCGRGSGAALTARCGARIGLLGGAAFPGLYQVFPTLAAFAGWNRGMMLLCLGVVTLWVLINLQNQALKRQAAPASALLAVLLSTCQLRAGEIQVILPGELAGKLFDSKRETTNSLVAFDPAEYQARIEATHFRVEARAQFQVLRSGERPIPLFAVPVYLQEFKLDSADPDLARLVTVYESAGSRQRPAGHLLFVSSSHREPRREKTSAASSPVGTVWPYAVGDSTE
jgi:hypothetical protein